MTNEITATITVNSTTFAKGIAWDSRRTPWRRWSPTLFACIAIGSFALLVWNPSKEKGLRPSMFLFGVSVGAIIGKSIATRNRQKAIDATPTAGQTAVFQFSEAEYSIQAPTSDGKGDWTTILDTYATPDGCLIYPQRNFFYWLPKTAFNSETSYNQFLDLLAAKTKFSNLP